MTTTAHRTAGSRGGNQYGEYKVRYASEKQVMFIQTLLSQKAHNEGEINFSTLNVQGATDLIKKLLTLPLREGYVIAPSEKQINFVKKLSQDKQGGIELLTNVLREQKVKAVEELSKQVVSGLINTLLAKEDTPVTITEVGAYLYEGEIYSIRLGVESRKWQVWSYSDEQKKYVRDESLLPLLKKIQPEHRLTLEQAINRSVQTGACCHCGRTLTLLKSVASGMGAVCAKKYH